MKALLEKIRKILRSRRTRQLLTRAVSGVAAIVVFITTYALVLPAITMEQNAFCGIPEHQHTDACYEERLVCEIPEGEEHQHDASCYEKFLICGKEVHVHSTECYQQDSSAVVSTGSGAAASTALGAFAEPDAYETSVSEFASGAAVMHSAAGGESIMEEPADEEAASAQAATEEFDEMDPVSDGLDTERTDGAGQTDAGTAVSEPVSGSYDNGSNGLEDTEQESSAGEGDTDLSADSSQDAAGMDLENQENGSSENIDADTTNPKATENEDSEEDSSAADTSEGDDDELTEKVNEEYEGLPLNPEDSMDINEGIDSDSDIFDASDRAATDPAGVETEDADSVTGTEEAANDATTNVLPENMETEKLSSGFVPELDSIEFSSVLNKHTDFFYFHPEEGQEIPASSAEVTEWKKVKNGLFGSTKLESTDLVKMYLSYTVPAGALNETNQVARYRLPSNIHLTDDQIIAINSTENGMSTLYADAAVKEDESMADEGNENIAEDAGDEARAEELESDGKIEESAEDAGTASGTDGEDAAGNEAVSDTFEQAQDENAANYQKYLGAEAIEGTRTPDEKLKEGAQEYISAIVKAENVFDEEGLYGEKGAFLGQDLIFIFTPYSIEKNQTIYNADGDPLSAGEKITGWFACDFNMSQIDWVEEDTDLDNSTVEKTAEVVFVEKDSEKNVKEISRKLKLVDTTEDQNDVANGGETAAAVETAAAAETAAVAETATAAETAAAATTASETAATDEAALASTGNTSEQAAPEDNENEPFKSGTLTADGDGYRITLDYTEEAKIPEKAELSVREITAETDREAYEACLEQAGQQVAADEKTSVDQKASRFFDIEILVKETEDNDQGETHKIEPAAPVSVNIQIIEDNVSSEDAAPTDKETSQSEPTVLHFAEEGVEQIDSTVKTSEDQDDNKDRSGNEENEPATEISFEAESFSIYGVVYTVDFHYEVNGKMYEFSLPGGGFVSFSDLVEMLDIIGDTNSDNNGDEKWADIAGFVSCVESLEFTNPGLMDVSKAEADTTVGQIKESRELACEYSTELTEEQIEEINAQTVEAGDWALISLQPFLSEEMLTVTMNDGEIFTIKVTDAQIRRDVLTADGKTYTITLTYSPSAGIPDDADLVVREITEGEEFARYLSDSAAALRIADEDVSFARFFDIEIVDGAGEKVEPLEPVQVTIAYADAIESSGEESLNVVHFAETGTEVINEVSLSEDGSEITYEQSSFSVTGTIQTGAPTNGGYYMLLVDYNGKTYMVNNDGTLTEVTTGQDANGNPDPNKIAVEYPMLWTYYYQYGGHFRFASEASGFNADNTASGYYYKYIDPNSDAGLREEHKNGDLNNLVSQTVVTYHDNSISNAGYNKYIGVSEEGGVLHIVGNTNASNAATIRLAAATNVLPSDPLKHSVNHIDIGFDASATITVPMAYGEYTLRDASGNVVRNLTVDQDHTLDVTLEAGKGKENEIIILPDDMKNAEIKAYRQSDYNTYKDNPEELARHELNDAFYITGYSQNNTTDFSEMQVRVEGSFKAATDISDADWRYYWDYNYTNWVKQQRLQHQVEYVVTLTKTVELPVTIEGYRVYDQDGIPLTVTVDIPMKDSFTYWDRRNECPPVQWDWSNWQSGDIATHGMSGMDFRLDGGNVSVSADIVALNITKYIEDMNGNPIKVGSTVTNSFDIYRDADGDPDTVMVPGEEEVNYNDYSFLHTKQTVITTGNDQNILHDYEVTPGMYYVREDPQSVRNNATITDTSGNHWQYKETEILTEYVWRGGADIPIDEKGRLSETHNSAIYTGQGSDSYNAIPDALGHYTVNGSSTAQDNNGKDWDLFNGFLEFYVINRYEKVEEPPVPPSEDTINIQLDKKWDDSGNTDAPSGTVTFQLYRQKTTTTVTEGSGGGNSGYTVTLEQPRLTARYLDGETVTLSFDIPNNAYSGTNLEYSQQYPWNGNSAYIGHYGPGHYDVVLTKSGSGSFGVKFINPENVDLNSVKLTGSNTGTNPTTTVVTDDPEPYGEEVTLPGTDGWSHTYSQLTTKEESTSADGKTKTTVTYKYYVVETGSTGEAAEYTAAEYTNNEGSDVEHAITGSGITRTIEVTNKKASLIVKKEWRGEANPDAYPPISFQLYQGWKNGSGVSEGWLYSDETYTISAEDGWEKVFNNLPATATHDEQTGEVGYYVKEVVPGDGTSWFSHVKINYESSAHSTMGDQNQPYNGGIGGNKGTLTIINTPPTYTQIHLIKQWFENNSGSWADITGDNNKTSNYAFGFIVQRAVKNEAAEPADGDYVDYGQEIVVSRNQVLVNDNQFTVVHSGSNWQFHVQGNNDPAQHENALVSEGYYEKSDGTKEWAQFAYRFKETYAYKLDTILNGTEVLPRDQWETQAWQPQYSSSGNDTIIRNYPIGSLDVTKDWQTEDPNLEIGSKIYFKVYRDGKDITPDIIEHPANYGLYSNQVYHDPDHPEHDSVVITSNGESFETVHLQGLVIGEPNSDQAHQYTVVEIGYSDQKNKDFWDDPLDTTDFEFLQGYVVDNGDDEQDCPGLTVDQLHTVCIKNLYKKTETEFAFTKVWQDSVGKGTNWQEPITVTLHQTKGDVAAGTDTPTGKTATFTVNPYGTTEQGEPLPRTFTFDGKTYEWKMEVSHEGSYYTFRIEHLPYKDGDEKIFSYYVTEEALGGYITSYAFKANETDPDLTIKVSTENPEKTNRALNGQYIINKQPGAALPNTGGPGTRLFTILGSILILGAGVLLWMRRRLI